MRRLIALLVVVVGSLVAAAVSATPASAANRFGSTTGTHCGAHGTFETYDGVVQVRRVVDTEDRATATHNTGCFGISPSGRIWWTPKSHPKWRQVSAHGRALWTVRSFMGDPCEAHAAFEHSSASCLGIAAPVMQVKTASGHLYEQWVPGNGMHSWLRVK